ncbi:MAG: type II toxin-antitoxin system HicB family antitoxin [Candidatus Aminicenantes bacterium]
MMLQKYIQSALEQSQYKILEDGTWFAEIPGFEGVWANSQTVENCRNELIEVLEEWLILKFQDGDQIPVEVEIFI